MNIIKYKIAKSFLVREYLKNKKTIVQIAKLNNCSYEVIRNRLIKYNIPIRNRSEVKKGNKNGNFIDGRTTKQYYCIDCLKKGIKTEIHYQTWKYGKNRCNPCAIKYKWQDKELRKKYSKILSGKNNPNYKDGLSREPYPMQFNEKLKEKIRDRDNYKCQLCDCSEIENNRKLDIHHIDYDKQNINPENLISLCNKCNAKVNGNRDYYFAYFTYIMEKN